MEYSFAIVPEAYLPCRLHQKGRAYAFVEDSRLLRSCDLALGTSMILPATYGVVSAHQLLGFIVYSVFILNREGQEGPTPACRNRQSCVIVKTSTCEVEYEFLNSGFNCYFSSGSKKKKRYHSEMVYTVNPQLQGKTIHIFTAGNMDDGRKP